LALTDVDAFALGARHLQDGVVADEHGNEREEESDQ